MQATEKELDKNYTYESNKSGFLYYFIDLSRILERGDSDGTGYY